MLKPVRPAFDVELSAALAAMGNDLHSSITLNMLDERRAEQVSPPVEEIIAGRAIDHKEFLAPGAPGEPDVLVSVFARNDHRTSGPGIFHTHGGGMIMGDRFYGIQPVLDWVETLDAVAATVEYRLAPEHPDPEPIEDCYAGLVWMAQHAHELNFDDRQLLVMGESAGGGLAAGISLLSRDRSGPDLAGQLLVYPMLDDRNQTISSQQLVGEGVWDRISNNTAWDALLGSRRRSEEVSYYAAPSRAPELTNLPPTYIEVGSVDVFRDECVEFASRMWASGENAELHVWPGAFHGYDLAAPRAAISVTAIEIRTRWIRRLLGV